MEFSFAHFLCVVDFIYSAERSSAGTAGAGVSVGTGWRVKVTESKADRAAPAVDQPRLVRPWLVVMVHLRLREGVKLGTENDDPPKLLSM